MKCKDIIDIIETDYPVEYALEWDNVGLLAGRDGKEVQCIYVALDVTEEVIDAAVAVNADMLITHHPMIFGGLKSVNDRDFIGARLISLIQNDISYYAMHTNYDVLGMAELSGIKMEFDNPEILEITADGETPAGIGRVANLQSPKSLRQCCEFVKEQFVLDNVKVFGDLDSDVRRIAISPGSGKSMIGAALEQKADVLITGDIGHHDGIDANARGLAIIDAGHYGIEHIFIQDIKQYLGRKLSGITVVTEPICHPFFIV